MFSADITWSPLADDSVTRKREQEEADRSKDAESLESKTSRSSKRLRWPFSKKSERSRNTHSYEDMSGSFFSSQVELPGTSIPSSPSHPVSRNECERIQDASNHLQDPRLVSNAGEQHENQFKESLGVLPSVLEVFELPAPTKVQPPAETALDHSIDFHQKYPSGISSTAILNPPRASYLGLSSGNQHARSPSSASLDQDKLYPRKPQLSGRAGPDDDDVASESTLARSKSRLSSSTTSVSYGTGFTSQRSFRKSLTQKGVPLPDLSLDSSYLYRIISRMTAASSGVILKRIKEDWTGVSLDERSLREIDLERRLWVLTTFFRRCLDINVNPTTTPFGPRLPLPAISKADRILELAHDIAELHHLVALQPNAKITYISTNSQAGLIVPLPYNVQVITIPADSPAILPLADSSFEHVRACSLPSVFPASKLKGMLQECYRLLAPRGVLELLIIDPIPCNDAGPELRGWIDDNLTLNLEKSFMCLRPALLIPLWVKEIGFSFFDGPNDGEKIPEAQQLSFPIISDTSTNSRLDSEVGRSMWQSTWGAYVPSENPDFKWFWEQEAVVTECVDRRSCIQCKMIFAYKV